MIKVNDIYCAMINCHLQRVTRLTICPQSSIILAEFIGVCWSLLTVFYKFLFRLIIRGGSEKKQNRHSWRKVLSLQNLKLRVSYKIMGGSQALKINVKSSGFPMKPKFPDGINVAK